MARKIDTLDVDHIVQDYLDGVSVKALAERHGVSRRVIDLRLDEAGIERRGRLAANRLMVAGRTPEENRANVAAAHAAVRGSQRSQEALEHYAAGRAAVARPGSALEVVLDGWLAERGLVTVRQQQVGPYNCDLGASPVAVEVFGGNWHGYGRHAARHDHRVRYLLDAGWHLVIVLVDRDLPLLPPVADYLVTFHQEASRDPSVAREYRVIGGGGQLLAARRSDDDAGAFVAPRRGRYC